MISSDAAARRGRGVEPRTPDRRIDRKSRERRAERARERRDAADDATRRSAHLGEDVHELALALVSPLRPQDRADGTEGVPLLLVLLKHVRLLRDSLARRRDAEASPAMMMPPRRRRRAEARREARAERGRGDRRDGAHDGVREGGGAARDTREAPTPGGRARAGVQREERVVRDTCALGRRCGRPFQSLL